MSLDLDDQFFVDDRMKDEMRSKYTELEKIVEVMKRVKDGLSGYTMILDPYRKLYEVIVPKQPIDTGIGVLPLRTMFEWIGAFILPVVVFFVGLPIASGFIRMSWKETGLLVVCLIGLYFINVFKQRLGVSN